MAGRSATNPGYRRILPPGSGCCHVGLEVDGFTSFEKGVPQTGDHHSIVGAMLGGGKDGLGSLGLGHFLQEDPQASIPRDTTADENPGNSFLVAGSEAFFREGLSDCMLVGSTEVRKRGGVGEVRLVPLSSRTFHSIKKGRFQSGEGKLEGSGFKEGEFERARMRIPVLFSFLD